MLYFSIKEYLGAAFYALILGAVFGILFRFVLIGIRKIKDILKIPQRAYALSYQLTRERIAELHFNSLTINKTLLDLVDFLFFICFGLGVILLNYLTLDGTPRIIIPILSAVSFYIVYKYPMRYFDKALDFAFDKLLKAICVILSLLIIPLRVIIKAIASSVSRIVLALSNKARGIKTRIKNRRNNRKKVKLMERE